MDAPVMRSLPQSIEAEQSVTGSMIIDKGHCSSGRKVNRRRFL